MIVQETTISRLVSQFYNCFVLIMEEYEGFEQSGDVDVDGSDFENDSNESGEERMVINPTSVRERIDQTLEVLANLKGRKADSSNSRSDLVASLAR